MGQSLHCGGTVQEVDIEGLRHLRLILRKEGSGDKGFCCGGLCECMHTCSYVHTYVQVHVCVHVEV